MILVKRNETDPYFNIAAEEYLLKNFSDEFVMIWKSNPSVVVGKHQNTLAEINTDFINMNNIPVIRRISGGGTVYHDEGNINYSIITTSENRGTLVDFHKFTKPLINFLRNYGIEASFEGKNNLTVGGKKISGNSAHVYKNRVLHHGTILFNTDLKNLEKSITPGDFSITDKAVKSIRANVTNLSPLLPKDVTPDSFMNEMISYFGRYFDIRESINLSTEDIKEINHLVSSKYTDWEWNYGYSPTFTFQNTVDDTKLTLIITKGVIQDIDIENDFINKSGIDRLLINSRFTRELVTDFLKKEFASNDLRTKYLSLFGFGLDKIRG
jgi:lipoate---protein ligase